MFIVNFFFHLYWSNWTISVSSVLTYWKCVVMFIMIVASMWTISLDVRRVFIIHLCLHLVSTITSLLEAQFIFFFVVWEPWCICSRAIFWMGLLHQKVWGLIGNSYQGDPLYVRGIQYHQHPTAPLLRWWRVCNHVLLLGWKIIFQDCRLIRSRSLWEVSMNLIHLGVLMS